MTPPAAITEDELREIETALERDPLWGLAAGNAQLSRLIAALRAAWREATIANARERAAQRDLAGKQVGFDVMAARLAAAEAVCEIFRELNARDLYGSAGSKRAPSEIMSAGMKALGAYDAQRGRG